MICWWILPGSQVEENGGGGHHSLQNPPPHVHTELSFHLNFPCLIAQGGKKIIPEAGNKQMLGLNK